MLLLGVHANAGATQFPILLFVFNYFVLFRFIVILLHFFFQSVFSQGNELFVIEINEKAKSDFESDYQSFKHKSKYFYEDKKYIVRDSCRGEFGGTIEFKIR